MRAAETTARYERAQLRADVLRAYSQVVAAEGLRDARQQAASGLEDLAGVASKRQQAGDLCGYESPRIAQASTQAGAEAALADTEARVARAALERAERSCLVSNSLKAPAHLTAELAVMS